jgi:peroxiredoxin
MGITAVAIVAVAWLANQPVPVPAGFTPVEVTGAAAGRAPVVGEPAPDFRASTDGGSAFRLSELKGSPVWLTFGASWCQPCRAENPDIQAAHVAWRDRGVRVVQVYMTEDAATIRRYAETVGLTYELVPDPDTRLAAAYRIVGIPSHFFVDRDGVLRQLKIGTLDPGTIEAALGEIAG